MLPEDICKCIDDALASSLNPSLARWDEWVRHHFGAAGVNISFYGDEDEDGLANILEYWAEVISPMILSKGAAHSPKRAKSTPIREFGLNPTRGDSDGDLLTDGFEWHYGLNAKGQVCL